MVNIEARNNVPVGVANAHVILVPVVEDPFIRTQLKDLSSAEAEAWLLNIERCFILHDYHGNVKVRWTIMQLRSFASILWNMELEQLGILIS